MTQVLRAEAAPRNLRSGAALRFGAAGLALLALAGAPACVGDYGLGVLLNLCLSVALGESWLVLSGFTGYVSLGHAVFFGLGAYVMAVSTDLMPWWAATGLGGLAAGLVALLLGIPALKVRGPYFVILTFGLSELVKYVVVTIESAVGNFGRIIMNVPDLPILYWTMLALAAASAAGAWAVQRSRFGAALRAIREDETAAETIGIDVRSAKIAAFVLSAVVPGMAGAIMAMRSAYFEPTVAFSPLISFGIVTTVMIGGSDSPWGPLLGGGLLGIASELLWASAPQVYNIILGLVLVVFVLRVPEGLYGRLVLWLGRGGRRREKGAAGAAG